MKSSIENKKIVIFGAGGMLGTALLQAFKPYDVHGFDKTQVDITNNNAVFDRINRIKPDVVINSAAYTDVDGCEKNEKHAFDVNGHAVKTIAESCKRINSLLVHISTDYVFDGKEKFYKEDDKPNPISIYGKSKALGEKNLIETLDNYYLIRTSWLFGKNGKNFVDTILKLAREKEELEVVEDQFGKPTYAVDLANKIREMIKTKKEFGIYHITNEGVCSWFQFAKKIVELAKLNARVVPITSEKLNRLAKRPKYSVLSNTKLSSLRQWNLALEDYMSIK